MRDNDEGAGDENPDGKSYVGKTDEFIVRPARHNNPARPHFPKGTTVI